MNVNTATNQGKVSFLLEIGSEEIPARFIRTAMTELQARTEKMLNESFLTWDSLRVMATPRRMAMQIEGLSERQADRELEIKGPPVSVAFDGDGNPTKAAEGFAKKAGVDLSSCERGSDKRGEFLLARKTEVGSSAAEVMAEKLPAVILSVPFRKVMRWGDHDLEYPRPLQWIVALLGSDVVPLEVSYFKAGRLSRGHRTTFNDQEVSIASCDTYIDSLREAGVVVDHNERRELIDKGLAELLPKADTAAALVLDEELIDEVVFLTEQPTPFVGVYSDEFSALPDELITTALKSHQRYFTINSGPGTSLLPFFAAVRDGGSDHLENVIVGNERVLKARLADALFYWDFDQKKTPDEQVAMLDTVTWIEGFGSVGDKSARVQNLAAWLWEQGFGENSSPSSDLARAAALSKSDLVSEMIKDGKEFTKLEGFIGARYAQLAGENSVVCQAIERHYLPRSSTGELPGDRVSSTLSVADRLDTLVGCWLAGFAPTGAKDPYALRRHVLAIVRILLDVKVHLDLQSAIEQALAVLADIAAGHDKDKVTGEIEEFIRTRLAGYFSDSLGCNADVVRAVLPVRWQNPLDALSWVEALTTYREKEDFLLLATGFKRCRNILKGDVLAAEEMDSCLQRWRDGGAGSQGEDFSKLVETSEIALKDEVAALSDKLFNAEQSGDYDQIFATLSGLGPQIDLFFENVRVNVDDPELTRLRHGFLREIYGLFARYADFCAIVPSDR